MQFGICTTVENSPAVKAAGWDFVEERVDLLLQGLLSDSEWKGVERAKTSVLPIRAANVLVPAALKITGPNANIDRLRDYMKNVTARAAGIGIKTLVFGSGGARNVPDGFDRDRARMQIIEFLKMIAPLVQARNIMLVIEHLNHRECNIINSVEEAIVYVRELNHPNIKCLIDSYHFWMDNENLNTIAPAAKSIMHVHVADKDGRVAPGLSGTADYRPFFAPLKRAGYDGLISVEALNFDIAKDGARVLKFLKDQWSSS
jgi:D-psicose/D-tagatose/L-ribulose 3-epimerase